MLDKYVLKELLQDIESSNKPKQQIVLAELCDKSPRVFGEAGTPLRRQVQQKFQKLKKLPFDRYLRVLSRLSVPQGQQTLELIKKQEAQKARSSQRTSKQQSSSGDSDSSDAASSGDGSDNLETSDSESDEGKSDEDTRSSTTKSPVGSVVVSTTSRATTISSPTSATLSTIKSAEEAVKNLTSSAEEAVKNLERRFAEMTTNMTIDEQHQTNKSNKPPLFSPPTPARPSFSDGHTGVDATKNCVASDAVLAATPMVTLPSGQLSFGNFFTDKRMYQNGTKDYPWIIDVNLEFPERNREFRVVQVEKLAWKSFDRNAFHISIPVAPPDYDMWEAELPYPPLPDPSLHDRVVQIHGPSLSFWERDPERYHKDIKCPPTKKAHVKNSVDINRAGESRQKCFWWLVFPEGVHLSNTIFSDDNITLDTCFNTIRVDAADKDNVVKKKLYGVVLYWRIAQVGGERIASISAKPEGPKLFAGNSP